MTITYELDLNSFQAWSGAKETLERIQREGKCEALENILEELYPDGMTETELNDLLWFEPETVYEWLGIRSEGQIEKEIEEAESELEEKLSDLEFDLDDDLTEEERAEIIESYQPEIDDIKERIAELKEELEEIYTQIKL